MPEVAGTQNAQAQASQQSKARVGLADNYETFLTLLTTQLANQDPLDPQDSQEFVSQLTAFTGVEQQIALKESMDSLLQLQSTSLQMNAVGFMGQKAIVLNDKLSLGEDGDLTWTYNLAREADETTVKVYDDKDRLVNEYDAQTGAGAHDFTWDGKNEKGQRLPEGVYRIEIVSKDAEGNAIETDTRTEGVVTGVDLSGSQVYVEIGETKIPLGLVVGIKSSTTNTNS
ncbi:flagellar hook assembly protein FlgD [Woodsholea maritima]|uniref:flagellar hook assembly protein FlgD n=1 Tax=Woodsholea maritima TaxID=240237 RepID=UPI00037608A1|nr:flagellar hook capping FlgD N-terminal domain-containing protein [Woodsholea maritima]